MSDSTPSSPLPGPSGFPIVGNLPQLRGDEMLWEKLADLRKEHGDIFLLHLGSLKMLVVFGHKLVKKMLVDRAESFQFRPQWLMEVKSLHLFNGIVWSNGLENDQLRKFVKPAVCPGLGPETLEEKIQTEASHLIDEIADNSCLDNSDSLRETIYRAVCNIKCAVIFGQRFSYNDPEFIEFRGLMDQLLQRHGVKNLKNFFPVLQLLPYDSKTKNLIDVLSKIKQFLQKYVTQAENTFDPEKLRSVLDLYVARKKEVTSPDCVVSEDNLTHVCRDLFVAGTENVTSVILWLLAYCMKFPDVLHKCQQSITQVVGNKQSINKEDLNKMTYIQATINEVLRVANAAPLSVPHATVRNVGFEGYLIPKETMVLTHLVSVHNDPEYWDSPELFNPDRFIGTDGTLIQKEAFYPFSIGPRYCVAEHLARLEISIIFVSILQNLHVTSPSVDQEPSLKPIQPGAFVEPEPFGLKLSRI